MNSEEALLDLVSSSVKTWNALAIKPPVTVDQLVVFAVVDLGKPALHASRTPVKQQCIFEWILERSRYYRKLAHTVAWVNIRTATAGQHGTESYIEPCETLRSFQQQFCDAFRRFGSPIRAVGKSRWTVSAYEAAVFLNPLRKTSGKGGDRFYPFTRLPPEIRLRIYGMVLAMPRGGVFLQARQRYPNWKGSISTLSNDVRERRDHNKWVEELFTPNNSRKVVHGFACPPSSRLLSLLLVNKAISWEARPVFFDINLVVFAGIHPTLQLLCTIPYSQIKHVRHVLLIPAAAPYKMSSAGAWTAREFDKLVKLLVSFEGLKQVDVYVEEAGLWTDRLDNVHRTQREDAFATAKTLMLLGRDRLWLLGDCDQLRAALEILPGVHQPIELNETNVTTS